MRMRSTLGWLQVAALSLTLVACDDDSPGGVDPTCAELCEDGDASSTDASSTDASTAIDSGDEADTGMIGETDSEIPAECDCGADAGDAGDTGDTGDTGDAEVDAGSEDSGQQDVEVVASCTDGIKNGSETDMDCGGSCAPCAQGLQCAVSADCAAPLACGSAQTCASGPTAGFTLVAATGVMPFNAAATSTAAPGDAAIVATEYNWGGTGAVYETSATHRYKLAGTYSVRQRVTDGNGLVSESAPQNIVVTDYAVRFSATDKTAQIALTNNRLDVGIVVDEGGVRSDASIAPRSGVFYFESKQLFVGLRSSRIGVGTVAASLEQPLGSSGQPSFGVSSDNQIGATFGCSGPAYRKTVYGFVVDYSGANPRIFLVVDGDGGAPDTLTPCVMTGITAPLHIVYQGQRDNIGPTLRINTGADTVNHPFYYPLAGVRAALIADGQTTAANSLVPHFGKTRTGAVSDLAPVVNVVPSALSVAVGTPVTLTATATDAVDGPLTTEIKWTDVSSQFFSRANGVGVGTGATFTFTPDRIGRYPIEASVTDSSETTTTQRVIINVTGTLQTFNPVRLVHDSLSDPATQISTNGLGARFVTSGKHGVRANQGIARGNFWYFEARRVLPGPSDLGAGLVIKGGNIHPYSFANVPWSMSINMGAGIWRNLISVGSYVPELSSYYGFAVDYRGEHPIVYVIHNERVDPAPSIAPTAYEMTLDDVWEPLYPMLYGNSFADVAGEHATINFTGPFQYSPAAVLGSKAAGLELGWGI